MYNIGRGKSGGVVLQCKACSHVERVNDSMTGWVAVARRRRKQCWLTRAASTAESRSAGQCP